MDHYEVLEIDSRADVDDIKKSFRKLARRWHPDRNPGDNQAEVRFRQVQAAWAVLQDEKSRKRYDVSRTAVDEIMLDIDAYEGEFSEGRIDGIVDKTMNEWFADTENMGDDLEYDAGVLEEHVNDVVNEWIQTERKNNQRRKQVSKKEDRKRKAQARRKLKKDRLRRNRKPGTVSDQPPGDWE